MKPDRQLALERGSDSKQISFVNGVCNNWTVQYPLGVLV